mmetsp:Transcript_67469/g.186856  ORF Transcript_67469/g.186856 Transcript_67469/m.186856 type:complete len:119 (+) Transcript_67469:51-407(+)
MSGAPGGRAQEIAPQGACGNFNGLLEDDTTEAILSRIGAPIRDDSRLFHSEAPIRTGSTEEELLQMCPPEVFARAQAECAEELRRVVPSRAESRACELNICYGANEHLLRMSKRLGLS